MSTEWSDYIKDITRQLPKSVPKLYNRPIVGRWSADTSADDKWRAKIGRSSADTSADHRPIAKTQKLSADGKKKYNKVVIIYFLSADEKRAKIWHFIGRLSADRRRG